MYYDWPAIVGALDYAFQPIANIHSGTAFGYEALLRNFEASGFSTIEDLFDAAYEDRVLYTVEMALRTKAIEKFVRIPDRGRAKLFFNIDNRIMEMSDYKPDHSLNLLALHGIDPTTFCIELSERHELQTSVTVKQILDHYRAYRFRLAIDDFGRGYSGPHLLYSADPDYIKIDRFFISQIADDRRKRIFVTAMVQMARQLNVSVVAEGVETEGEFVVCREIGCDLVQGFLVGHPTLDVTTLRSDYPHVAELVRNDRRRVRNDSQFILQQMLPVPAISADTRMPHVFNAFRQHRDAKLFPVVESDGEPIGVIHEEAVKNYAYLPFGRDLLSNRSYAVRLRDLISECPIADINTPAEKIIDTFATNSTHDGIIICRDLKYAGFLSAASMLALLAEKNLALARDQNPLTRLAGNTLIYEYVSQALSEAETAHLLVYLDFDYFKPFNDHYGFRHGDRVIVLFADLLRSSGFADRRFIGHVGGDDFFIGYRGVPKADALLELRQLVEKFKFDAQSFYDAKARSDGFILGQDRDGRMRRFPLLEVSAVAVDLAGQGDALTIDDISAIIAANKTLAKRAVDKVRLVTVSPRGSEGAQNEISAALPNIPQMISK